MKIIKEVNTGKARLVIVEVPEYTFNHNVDFRGKYWGVGYEFDKSQPYTHGGFAFCFKDFGGKKNYPKSLEVLGLTNELTQQQLDDILPFTNAEWQGNENENWLVLKRV